MLESSGMNFGTSVLLGLGVLVALGVLYGLRLYLGGIQALLILLYILHDVGSLLGPGDPDSTQVQSLSFIGLLVPLGLLVQVGLRYYKSSC